jgi:hypothetical protein
MEPAQALILFGTVAFALLVPFVVVPEILERKGRNPRSRSARALVWTSFLLIVLIPAALSGFLFTVRNPADWALFFGALAVAILYDYYRLKSTRIAGGNHRG